MPLSNLVLLDSFEYQISNTTRLFSQLTTSPHISHPFPTFSAGTFYVSQVAFKHLRSYRDGACLQQWYFDQCAATQNCHAANTGHSIQTQGRPVVVLSMGVERHTGIHNYPMLCLESESIGKSSTTFHTHTHTHIHTYTHH